MSGVKTVGHKKALSKVENPVCGICLEPILHIETATVDHIIPISLGGSNHRNNVQLAHPKCNRKKGNDPNFLPISLRKTRCPACHRWLKNLAAHTTIKHPHQPSNIKDSK